MFAKEEDPFLLKSKEFIAKDIPRPISAPSAAPPGPPTENSIIPPTIVDSAVINNFAISALLSFPSPSKIMVDSKMLSAAPIAIPKSAPLMPSKLNPIRPPAIAPNAVNNFSVMTSAFRSSHSKKISWTRIAS